MTIYQEILLDHYKNPKNKGRLSKLTKSVTVHNPLCGDEIIMDILFDQDEKVKSIAFSGKGCVISQATASQLTELAKNQSKDQLRKLDRNYIINLLGIELGPNRLKCALLPLEALHKITK
ncbi:MAG: iron-sulfur cluster assembly scaffold protein [bacterium]|nr:iron-sulfur cluster assembly scaffold protein [bacterium]